MSNHFYRYWLPVISWAAVIFVVSSIYSFPKPIQPLFSLDKVAHTFEYAVLGFLLARALKNSKKNYLKKYFRVLAVICVIVYGITDEWHQYFVPLRTVSFLDVVYDTIGGLIGQWFLKE